MAVENELVKGLLTSQRQQVIDGWVAEAGSGVGRSDATELVDALSAGLAQGGTADNFDHASWAPLRDALARLSRTGASRGDTAGATSRFVLAVKRPLFTGLQKEAGNDPARFGAALWAVSALVDRMAQHTADTYQRSREEVIHRQQQELLELSTPVVKLWDGVLAVPMIGALDSARTQLVMESLLQRIVETGSELAIMDITGVPTVDTLVAQHLLKTVTAIRLMGADCIISGVRPQIAQTIVHLGIDLQGITTKASLADALALAMKRTGYTITRTGTGA